MTHGMKKSLALRRMLAPVLAALILSTAANCLAGHHAEQMVRRIVEETNKFREKEGRKPLQSDPKLSEAALKHAEQMAREEKMSHDGFSGFIREAGYRFSRIAENIATFEGHFTADDIVDGWKKSPGHRKNLLDPHVSEIGVGIARGKSGRCYVCQDFGHPRGTGRAD